MRALDAVVDEFDAAQSLVRHGHAHDLIVLGQAQPALPGYARAQALVEQVALHASRPLLVVPYAGDFDGVGRVVLVGWNGRREAARAAADAMPLLCAARAVHLVEVRHPVDADDDGAGLRAAIEWLRWHGVEATPHVDVGDLDAGNALLSRASDLGADLIVMGAWGHARWTERVLGGATRSLLAQMTLPVLMSH